jgi:isocitrate/isopropylmalate dehydrogenase
MSLHPFVETKHPKMDIVIIRENEDLYAGIEHQQTDEVIQCLKLISRPGVKKLYAMHLNMPKCMVEKSDLLYEGQHHEAN